MADLTYADAVAAVRKVREKDWPGTPGGNLAVGGPDGMEDVLDYLVPWGARECLVDGDQTYLLCNGLVTFVDKRTGWVRDEMMPEQFAKVDLMTPVVGAPPAS